MRDLNTIQKQIDETRAYIRKFLIKNYSGLKNENDFETIVADVTSIFLKIPENNRRDTSIPWALKHYFEQREEEFNKTLDTEDAIREFKSETQKTKYYKSGLYDEMFYNENDTLADIHGRNL